MMIGETVIVQTATTVADPYSGEQVPSWSSPIERVVSNVLVADGGSTEPEQDARNAVDSDFDLIFQPPVTTAPTAQDRVKVRGLVCEVVGRPFLWKWPGSGEEAGMVVKVKIREG